MNNHCPSSESIAVMTSKMLLEINAVHFNAKEPFTFTSGIVSPVYIDCRKIISFPRIRNMITRFFVSIITQNIGFEQFDAIAGGETAGIPFAAWIANEMGLPMHYVRKKPKGFGRTAQIEGDIQEKQRVLLVEDLATDGGSKANFCKALRNSGAISHHTVVIFYYDIFRQTRQKLRNDEIELHSLATWWDVLRVCKLNKYFPESTLVEVECFLKEPLAWSTQHGGVSNITI